MEITKRFGLVSVRLSLKSSLVLYGDLWYLFKKVLIFSSILSDNLILRIS